jgi:hypothetical protein
MGALTSASTYDDALGQYKNYASYTTAAEATLFIEACRHLLVYPRQASKGSAGFSLSPELVEKAEARASAWLAQNNAATNAGARHFDFREFRT